MARKSRENRDQKIPPCITLRHVLEGHSEDIKQIAWSPDGRILASGSEDKTIRLWDMQTGQTLQTLTGHSDVVTSIEWSRDGSTLAPGSWDDRILVWNKQTRRPL